MITTVGSTTTSTPFQTVPGANYVAQCSSGSTFVAVLQSSLDGTNWANVYVDTTNTASFGTINQYYVPGGPQYRINVTTWNATVTFQMEEAGAK